MPKGQEVEDENKIDHNEVNTEKERERERLRK